MQQFNYARLLVKLYRADVEFNDAHDALCAAKHATGKRDINPLPNDHPAIQRKKDAVARRNEVLAEVAALSATEAA